MTDKTPREFRNAMYQHLVDHNVSIETASVVAVEAELYVEAYEQFKLGGFEFAAKSMGLREDVDGKTTD